MIATKLAAVVLFGLGLATEAGDRTAELATAPSVAAPESVICDGCKKKENGNEEGEPFDHVLVQSGEKQIVVREQYSGYTENCDIGHQPCSQRTCRFSWYLETYTTGGFGTQVVEVDEDDADPYTVRSKSGPHGATEFMRSNYASDVLCGFSALRTVELGHASMGQPFSKTFEIGCKDCQAD